MSTGELADQLFDLVDANKDGKVSISEFNKFMEALGRAETQYEDWTKLCGLEETKCDPAFGIPKDKWNPWMAKETEEELKIQIDKLEGFLAAAEDPFGAFDASLDTVTSCARLSFMALLHIYGNEVVKWHIHHGMSLP